MYKPQSKLKIWAQKRNFSLYRLKGIEATLRILKESDVLIEVERRELNNALEILKLTITFWKRGNRESKMMADRI